MTETPTHAALRQILDAAESPATLTDFIRHPALDERRALVLEALAVASDDEVRYLSLSHLFTILPGQETWVGRLETEANWESRLDSGSTVRNSPIGDSYGLDDLMPSAHARLRLAALDACLAIAFTAAAQAFLPAAAALRLGLRAEMLSHVHADGRPFCAVLYPAFPEHPLLAGGRAIGAPVSSAGHEERLRLHLHALAAGIPDAGPNPTTWNVTVAAPHPQRAVGEVVQAIWTVRAQNAADAAMMAAARADAAALAAAEAAVHPVPNVTVLSIAGPSGEQDGAPYQMDVDALLATARTTWLPVLRTRLRDAALHIGF